MPKKSILDEFDSLVETKKKYEEARRKRMRTKATLAKWISEYGAATVQAAIKAKMTPENYVKQMQKIIILN